MGRVYSISQIVAVLLLFSVTAHPQAGQSGFAFLKMGVGGRALSMAEAYSAIARDPSAMYYNPAALSLSKTSQLILMRREWFHDVHSEFIGASASISKLSFGLSINSTSANNIQLRETAGPPQGMFDARNMAIGISAAFEIDPSLSIGATGKYLYEKILIDEASGVGFDFGGIYRTPWDFKLGFAVNNLGSANELRHESSQLPTLIRIGAAFEKDISSLEGTITLASDVVSSPDEKKTHIHIGAELDYRHAFAIRTGFQSGYESRNITTGIGLHYDAFRFDYAFVPMRYDLGATHAFSLGITFP